MLARPTPETAAGRRRAQGRARLRSPRGGAPSGGRHHCKFRVQPCSRHPRRRQEWQPAPQPFRFRRCVGQSKRGLRRPAPCSWPRALSLLPSSRGDRLAAGSSTTRTASVRSALPRGEARCTSWASATRPQQALSLTARGTSGFSEDKRWTTPGPTSACRCGWAKLCSSRPACLPLRAGGLGAAPPRPQRQRAKLPPTNRTAVATLGHRTGCRTHRCTHFFSVPSPSMQRARR